MPFSLVFLLTLVAGCSSTTDGAPHAIPPSVREAARLEPCPTGSPSGGPLRAMTLTCLATGLPLDLGTALGRRPALVNLWAYWCRPCVQELPLLQDYARRVGDRLTVLTVHSDPDERRALAMLAGLGVRLPGVQDPDAQVRTSLGAPPVLPLSVLIRPDGSVAQVIVRPFTGVDDIAAVVEHELGVKA